MQPTKIMEATGGVSTAAFTNISGQIVYAETLKKYEDEDFVFSKLIPERPSKLVKPSPFIH